MDFVNPWILLLGDPSGVFAGTDPLALSASSDRSAALHGAVRAPGRRTAPIAAPSSRLLILAARTAAVLLLSAAIARPLIGRRPPASALAPGLTTRVVILDLSQSMAAQTKGVQSLERAARTRPRTSPIGPVWPSTCCSAAPACRRSSTVHRPTSGRFVTTWARRLRSPSGSMRRPP